MDRRRTTGLGVPRHRHAEAHPAEGELAASGQRWTEDFSNGAVKGIGAFEILGALGLILPALLNTATILVPLAATGLVLLMIGAAITHARRREYPNIAVNAVWPALHFS